MTNRGLRWPFVYALLIVLGLAAAAFAGCPLLTHSDPEIQREFMNVCQTIVSPVVSTTSIQGAHISSATIDNLVSSTGTISTLNVVNLNGVNFKKSGFSTFEIVQIATATTNSASTTTAGFANADLLVNITPKSASSTLLVMAYGTLGATNNSNRVYATIARDGNNLFNSSAGAVSFLSAAAAAGEAAASMMIPDPAVSTAATTYRVQIKSDGAGTTARWNAGTSESKMIVIEIL